MPGAASHPALPFGLAAISTFNLLRLFLSNVGALAVSRLAVDVHLHLEQRERTEEKRKWTTEVGKQKGGQIDKA